MSKGDPRSIMKKASSAEPRLMFACNILSPESNEFVELWAPKIHAVVEAALGPFGIQPMLEIRAIDDGFHLAGANASFNPGTGQICLATSVDGQPGVILEKLTHEMIHASLAQFPEGDPFYEEGLAADYPTWVMAHAPCWGEHREAMIKAAADNIRNRRERALRTGNDYDRKRWAGGVFAMTAYGPYIITMLRQRKIEGNLTW